MTPPGPVQLADYQASIASGKSDTHPIVTQAHYALDAKATWTPAGAGPVKLEILDGSNRVLQQVEGSGGATGVRANHGQAAAGQYSVRITNLDTTHTLSCRGSCRGVVPIQP